MSQRFTTRTPVETPLAMQTSSSNHIPLSAPQWPQKPSLCNLPAELRLEICNHLLSANNIPCSYGYTGPISPSANKDHKIQLPPRPPHRHALLFVSKQFSAEYRQCYFERTTFFLRVDRDNAFSTVPELDRHQKRTRASVGVPNFWRAPDALLRSLRHCTLYIELGDIASAHQSRHSVALNKRDSRNKLKAFGSLSEIRAQDAIFDTAIISSILLLLPHMQQLRTVQLVWDTSTESYTRAWGNSTKWNWETMGEVFVDCLKRKGMRRIVVKVGDRFGHDMWKGKWDDGEWKGTHEKIEGARTIV
ncbi:hypothetical protein K458DRAFT_415229 [Lentithecium fluviatile CBS 122367]|uniref:Uncharacterized protein n=1 Tax=Lentithecium fluviatile CBS 122367 TaxID=1168545 RepID=A0A6G1JCE7_9PLEO|nr:hypothetical protein K458DRAFT_415229 [Lentithecium fluviatile CBS 122367]